MVNYVSNAESTMKYVYDYMVLLALKTFAHMCLCVCVCACVCNSTEIVAQGKESFNGFGELVKRIKEVCATYKY